jgi:tuftelin-interacting protein 11
MYSSAAFRVASLAIALVFPLIRRSLDAWQPLSDPASPLALLAQWRPLLESSPGSAEHDSSVDEDVYRRLLDELIVPKLRTTLISEWQPSLFPLQGISLIDAWRPPCLPVSLHRTLLSSVILPRLQRAAESWDPRSPVCPPAHTWLHCWLPLLGEAMEPIHSTVRHKVTNALSDWQPSDIVRSLFLSMQFLALFC